MARQSGPEFFGEFESEHNFSREVYRVTVTVHLTHRSMRDGGLKGTRPTLELRGAFA